MNIRRAKPLKPADESLLQQLNFLLFTHTPASYLEIKYIIVLSLAPAVHLGKFPPPPDGEIKMKYPDHTLYSKHICLKAAAESGTFL